VFDNLFLKTHHLTFHTAIRGCLVCVYHHQYPYGMSLQNAIMSRRGLHEYAEWRLGLFYRLYTRLMNFILIWSAILYQTISILPFRRGLSLSTLFMTTTPVLGGQNVGVTARTALPLSVLSIRSVRVLVSHCRNQTSFARFICSIHTATLLCHVVSTIYTAPTF
jgi:hypothetical protein